MASVFAKGVSYLKNISREPEVLVLINWMNKSGAQIRFKGKRTIKITGVKKLKGGTHEIIADRIEAFSFLCVAVITRGKIKLNNKKVKSSHKVKENDEINLFNLTYGKITYKKIVPGGCLISDDDPKLSFQFLQ